MAAVPDRGSRAWLGAAGFLQSRGTRLAGRRGAVRLEGRYGQAVYDEPKWDVVAGMRDLLMHMASTASWRGLATRPRLSLGPPMR
jgi:uncharacterized protein involved in copper resistance